MHEHATNTVTWLVAYFVAFENRAREKVEENQRKNKEVQERA